MGYLLRLTGENGYVSPWSIYRLAELRQSEIRTSGIRVERLAKVANRAASEMCGIAFTPPPEHPRWAQLLGHVVLPTDLNVVKAKLCPQCVTEIGFIEAHWHLELMVACPVHRRGALLICPKCGDRLSWFRPGLLECKCGGNLQAVGLDLVSEAEASLLDVIRRKTLTLPTSEENPAYLPQDQLMTMNLRSLLSVVRTLGKHRMIADGASEDSSEERVVSAASQVLIDWPKNFIALFTDLGRSLPETHMSGVGRQFASIYTSLFKSKAMKPRQQTDFMKVAFLDFAMNHWGRGYVDHKLMQQLGALVSKRYLTQTEFAARIGVEQSTVARLLKGSTVSSRRVKSGRSERILVDLSQSPIPRTLPGKIFRKREAARRIGFSVSVLEALKSNGLYEVSHLLPTRAGFHELDVEAFRQKLMALASRRSRSTDSECLTLRHIMRGPHDSLAIKVSVLRAVFSGEINVVADADGTPGGLVLDSNAYKRFVQDARIRAAGDTLTLADVAKTLGCDSRTVPGLVRLDLLQGTAAPSGLRITAESVQAFQEKYVSLARIAKEEGSTSRALMERCYDNGIDVLFVPTMRKGGPQPFILVADREELNLGSFQSDPLPALECGHRPAEQLDRSATTAVAKLVTGYPLVPPKHRVWNQEGDASGKEVFQ